MRGYILQPVNKRGPLPSIMTVVVRPDDALGPVRWGGGAVAIGGVGVEVKEPSEIWALVDSMARDGAAWVVGSDWAVMGGLCEPELHLINRGYQCVGYVHDGAPPTIVRYRKGRRSVVLLDAANILSTDTWASGAGVVEEAERLGLAMEAWAALIDKMGWGKLRMTLGSQAMAAYRAQYLTDDIYIHDRARTLLLERRAYRGGLIHAFRHGVIRGPVHLVDIRSSYPAVMKQERYPVRAIVHRVGDSIFELAASMEKGMLVVADYRQRDGVRRQATTPEINIDQIDTLYRWAEYDGAKCFALFVDAMWAERQRGNQAAKRLSNALYGKWGQRAYDWEPSQMPLALGVSHVRHNGVPVRVRWRQGMAQVRIDSGEPRLSAPSIAGHITAYGRQAMRRLLSRAEGHVMLCDTDGMVVDDTGLAAVLDLMGDGLGDVRLVESASDVEIRGPREYRIGERWVVAGLPRGSQYQGNGVWDMVTRRTWNTSQETGAPVSRTRKRWGVKR